MACSESLPDLVQKNEKAIFKIFTFDHDGDASFTGSGFFIDDEGTGVTNHHVMEEAVSAFVKLPDGSIFEVEKIITERTDIELCKFQIITNGKKTPFIKLDQSLPLKGSAIFVIGSPKGLDNSVSTGIIAAVRKNEYLSESNFDFFSDYYQGDLIQFTAPFYHGNSGSPIMNMRGKVVRVGAAGVEDNESESINIAFPIQALDSLAAMEPRVLSSGKSNLHYVFADAKDHPVIINSIELEDSVTILHCKYFNIDLMENPALLYTEIDSTHQDFYIEDVKTKKSILFNIPKG
jgi:serine protease Do